jgi:hypothetical protein
MMRPRYETDLRTQPAPKIFPDISFPLDPAYSGRCLVAGDLNGDGRLEFITARNVNQEITAFAVYSQIGTILWTWGTPGSGQAEITYDLPLQIYDINADGHLEVIFSIAGELLILEGNTGKELQRYPLPSGLRVADCICFANLTGNATATDILIKDRYQQIWAYTNRWELLWTWTPPKGHKTCHHPTPISMEPEVLDAVYVGPELLDAKGKRIWSYYPTIFGIRGHLDSVRIVSPEKDPNSKEIILTYCGARTIALLNRKGKPLWKHRGYHFESITVGHFLADAPSPQFYVDIDHLPFGDSIGVVFDHSGHHLTTLHLDYGRHHRALDWNGDGLDELVIANALALVTGRGERIGTFQFTAYANELPETKDRHEIVNVSILDITGKGNGDILLHSSFSVNIYLHPDNAARLPSRFDQSNFTFY